jgi:hypothetical protein
VPGADGSFVANSSTGTLHGTTCPHGPLLSTIANPAGNDSDPYADPRNSVIEPRGQVEGGRTETAVVRAAAGLVGVEVVRVVLRVWRRRRRKRAAATVLLLMDRGYGDAMALGAGAGAGAGAGWLRRRWQSPSLGMKKEPAHIALYGEKLR